MNIQCHAIHRDSPIGIHSHPVQVEATEAEELIGKIYARAQTEEHYHPCVKAKLIESSEACAPNSIIVVPGQGSKPRWKSCFQKHVYGDGSKPQEMAALMNDAADVMRYHREGGIDPRPKLEEVFPDHPASALLNRYSKEGAERNKAYAVYATDTIAIFTILGFLNGLLVCAVLAFKSV